MIISIKKVSFLLNKWNLLLELVKSSKKYILKFMYDFLGEIKKFLQFTSSYTVRSMSFCYRFQKMLS